MAEALESHKGSVSVDGRNITDMRFADDIDGLAEAEDVFRNLKECLDEKSRAAGMEISAELEIQKQ